jgi:hypothetical protein
LSKTKRKADGYQPDFLSGREPLHTVPEAALLLGLSRSAVWRLVRDGQLGYVLKTGLYRKVYHIPASALRSFEHVRDARGKLKEAERANRRLIDRLSQLREKLGETDRKPKSGRSKSSGSN